jgi:GntR family transcriptional regulator/MocR family aminotransferase
MSVARRHALLRWAHRADAWIIEDDYDGGFRYGGKPLTPLHALARSERVLYMGTFSKVLAPGLRLGYLVLPRSLAERFAMLKAAADRHAPALTQRLLARFIVEGRFAAHLRRMRVLYAGRRAALLSALEAEAAGLLVPLNAAEAGLHLAVRAPADLDDEAAAALALAKGVNAWPLSNFHFGTAPQRGFVLGFAGTDEARFRPAIRTLVAAMRAAPPLRAPSAPSRGTSRAAGS